MMSGTVGVGKRLCLLLVAWCTIHVSTSGVGEVHNISTNGTFNSKNVSHGNASHGNGSHGNDSHGDAHASIHVASWRFEYVKEPLVISLFVLVAGLAKLGFHHADFLVSVFPESCLLICVGTITGGIIYGASQESDSGFDTQLHPETFFLFLLPPIILEASYSLHDRVFFDNIGTIMIYAVLGTVINCFVIGPLIYALATGGAMGGGTVMSLTILQCLVFSALVVAVDPVAVLAIFQEVHVNNVLYFLVFGESLFNDAVTVVLYNMMISFNKMSVISGDQIALGFLQFLSVSLCGTAIGLLFGVVTSFFTKLTKHVRVVEPLAVFSLAYLSYLVAEMFHFSGIISIIFCGLVQAQYAFHNLSNKSLTTVKYFTKMMSATCDSIIFLFLGFALVRQDHEWHSGFVFWTLLLCLVIRFLVVFSLTFIINNVQSRLRQISAKEQFIMSYGGLRGAVCFSLVTMLNKKEIPFKNMFQTTVLAVIIFTVFIQGMSIKPFVKLLSIRRANEEKQMMFEAINDRVTDHVMAGVEEILGKFGNNMIREWCAYFDDTYLKHWFQREPTRCDENLMELYEQISLREHYANLYGEQAERKIDEVKKGIPTTHSVANALSMMFAPDTWKLESPEQKKEVLKQTTPEGRRRSLHQLSQSFDLGGEESSQTVVRRPKSRSLRNRIRSLGRHSVIGAFISKRMPTDGSSRLSAEEDVTADRLKDILQSNQAPTASALHRKYDRNISRDHDNDLLHHLQQKTARRTRLLRSLSVAAPTEGLAEDHRSSSLEAVPELGETVFRNRCYTETSVPQSVVERMRAAKNGGHKYKNLSRVDESDNKLGDHQVDGSRQPLVTQDSEEVFEGGLLPPPSELEVSCKTDLASIKASPLSRSTSGGHKLTRMDCVDICDADKSASVDSEDRVIEDEKKDSETRV